MSWPRFLVAISCLLILLNATGVCLSMRTPETKTSSSLSVLMESLGFSCEKEKIENRRKSKGVHFVFETLKICNFATKLVFIRKERLRIKGVIILLVKIKNDCFLWLLRSVHSVFCQFSLNSITCSRFYGYNLSYILNLIQNLKWIQI